MNSFAQHYALLADDDLIRVSADTASLLPQARQALRLELEYRGLPISGTDWNAQPAPTLDSRKSVIMRRVFVAGLAIVIILLGLRAVSGAVEFAKERYFALSIGFIVEAAVEFTTGILILMNHNFAIYFAGASAVLLTLDALVGGLSLLDILQVVLAWMGFFWYRSLRFSNEKQILDSK